jgi:NADH dehydrogenase
MSNLRIVIIGAGFVGLPVARQLQTRLAQAKTVTLIDAKDHFLFAPRLVDALAHASAVPNLTAPLADLAKASGFSFLQGAVTHIDRTRQTVFVTDAAQTITPVPYDILVLSQGSTTNFYGLPEAESRTFPLKSLGHVTAIHARIDEMLAHAKFAPEETRKKLLSFAVIGAGPSGVESLFALRRYALAAAKKTAPELAQHLSFSLLQAAPQILPGFPSKLVHRTMDQLAKHGVRVYLGKPVTQLGDGFLMMGEHERVDAGLVLWTAGVAANRIDAIPPFGLDRGGCIAVDHYLRADEHIFAAGDCVLYQEKNVVIPKNAQTALQMSHIITENIVRSLSGQPLKPLRYRNHGNIISLQETGFLNLGRFTLQTRLAPWLRDLFYGIRFRQITQ